MRGAAAQQAAKAESRRFRKSVRERHALIRAATVKERLTRPLASARGSDNTSTREEPMVDSFFEDSPEVPGLPQDLPESWQRALGPQTRLSYWRQLVQFLAAERSQSLVFPPETDVFNAFRLTPLKRVKVLILGQDPYPTPGHAHGLCFSVRPGVKIPASLRNIYRELEADVNVRPVAHGCLQTWAERGVLLLNACLTVRSGQANSHTGKGWELFTDAAIQAVNDGPHPVAFVLWGNFAQKKARLIDARRHIVIPGVHPSPLSASAGFFGSKPFSRVNAALIAAGREPIDWQLPDG
jgi:uracil-DNA glycosylase